jgi:DNA-binding response OmpR family regulator
MCSEMSKTILLVDDDALMRRSMAYNLNQAGYETVTAASAEDALTLVENSTPDLVLLDINLPNMDGLDALRHFQYEAGLPVIFVTARRRELDEVLGLEMGADDYVTKPFSMDVLLARIKTVLRRREATRQASQMDQSLMLGDLVIDPAAHTVLCQGQPVDLAPRAFDLLRVLALNAGRVMSTDELLTQVWGAEYEGEPQVVYVHIRWLREKLEDDPSNPKRIVTVRGIGYKLLSSEALSGV